MVGNIITAAGLLYPNGSAAVFSVPEMQSRAAGATPVDVDLHVKTSAWARLGKYAPWGDSNNLPAEIKKDIEDNPIIGRALRLRKGVHYGRGLLTYREAQNGSLLNKEPVRNPRFDALLRNSDYRRLQKQFVSDYEDYANTFPIISLNEKREIVCVRRAQAFHSRWTQMNDRGRIENLALSADWPVVQDNKVQMIPALDHLDPLEDLRSRKTGYKFAVPITAMERGNQYYNATVWDGVRAGWLKVAFQVPKMKTALMANQMLIKYHIRMPYDYFTRKYTNWADLTVKQQDEKIRMEIKRMDEWLKGADNAGKSFISFYDTDPATKKEFPGVKIDAVADLVKEGQGIIDSKAANTEILFALGVDPVLIGALPGSSESGSGSNKRESYWILQNNMWYDREQTLEIWKFCRDYMGIAEEELEIGYRDVDTSQTLNENPTGKREVA